MASPAPSALSADYNTLTGKVGVMSAASPDQRNACTNQVASAPAPSGLSDADVTLWRNQEQAKCQGSLKEMSVADLVLSGEKPYIDLVVQGQTASSKTPGYPGTASSIQLSNWPTDSDTTQTATGASIQYWNVTDTQGQLKELVYTDASGTSNVLFKSSTTASGHVVSLTPGGSKIVADKSQSVVATTGEEEGTSVTVYIGGSCCVFILCGVLIGLALRRK